MRTNIFIAFAAASLCTSLFAAVKPLAIWNGEFPSGGKISSLTRNGVTLNRKSSVFRNQYVGIQNGVPSPQITWPDGKHPYSVLANIRNISALEKSQILFGYYTSSKDLFWIFLDKDMKMGADKDKSYDTNIQNVLAIDSLDSPSEQHTFGFLLTRAVGNMFSLGTIDGNLVHSNKITSVHSDVVGVKIGGKSTSSGNNLSGAQITYIAVFPENDDLSLGGF